MGEGGGSAVMLLNRTNAVMLLKCICVHIHYLGKWEGVGLGNLEFFGPQMALAKKSF
jgi:hypothetical protein